MSLDNKGLNLAYLVGLMPNGGLGRHSSRFFALEFVELEECLRFDANFVHYAQH